MLTAWQAIAPKSDAVFPNQDGNRFTYSGFRSNFRHFLARHNLPNVTLHQFRHQCATLLLQGSESPKTAQQILGHSDVKTTLGVYSHILPETLRQTANGTLANAFNALTQAGT